MLVHCQGESGNVLVNGAPDIPGSTILEKMEHLNAVDDSLRRFLISEPRAHPATSVNLLLPPCRPDADAAFIVLQPGAARAMSGSNCICVVTALLETGLLPMVEPETVVRIDTAAGLVTARAHCADGRCLSVSLDNVPAFAVELQRPVTTPQWGTISADIAFGGLFYALIDVDQVGLTIAPENARALAEAGVAIRALLNEQIEVVHPEEPGLRGISLVMFRDRDDDGAVRTCTTLEPARVDRSPCGTGSSANLAALYEGGEVVVGDRRISRSITGGEFIVEAVGATLVGGRRAVLPRITGSASIYGREELYRPSGDEPFPEGFALSDLWGEEGMQ
jgi:proline racemase